MSTQSPLPIGTQIDDLQITKVLSVGAFGHVYVARSIHTFKRYAIKSLPHTGLDSHQLAFQRNEITLHSHLSDHPYIIRLEKVVQTHHWTHAVLEYGSEGDLFSAITEKNIYYGNHSLIRDVFLQLIDAVKYCHDNHIYHRDLKPENILAFNQGHTIKLADFGLATTEVVSTDYGCGSTFYYSPECQGKMNRSRSGYVTATNDIWSMGVILINLTAGKNPWRVASMEDDVFAAFVKNPDFLYEILPISHELNSIVKRIFCIDPIHRIGLDELYHRIRHCTFFTRTPEVMMAESKLMSKSVKASRNLTHLDVSNQSVDSLPSPPCSPDSNWSMSSDSSSIDTLADAMHSYHQQSWCLSQQNDLISLKYE